MGELCVKKIKGCLALCGDLIESVAEKWKTLLGDVENVEAQFKYQQLRDQNSFHLTVMSAAECKTFDNLSVEEVNKSLQGVQFFDVGIGRIKDQCLYVVVFSPKLQNFRKQHGLGTVDFHITLGFDGHDVHTERKDVSTLWIKGLNREHFAGSLEKVLSAPSSQQTRKYLDYNVLVEMAMESGYLFGAYFYAKFAFEALADEGYVYNMLLSVVTNPKSKCKAVDGEKHDYGSLVSKVLNCNVRAKVPHHRLRRWYQSTLLSNGEEGMCYSITFDNFMRNFSYVADNLLGSSSVSRREYFEMLVRIGVTDVITVMEAPLPKEHYDGLDIQYHFFEVQDRTPPTMTQMQEMITLCADRTKKVLVHCLGGVGRTATVLIASLMWTEHIGRHDGLARLAHRKTILSASQEDFLNEWYKVCASHHVGALSENPPAYSGNATSQDQSVDNSRPRVPSESTLPLGLPPLILLVGYPASGKSTFAQTLLESFPRVFTRINQDEQGREACERQIGELISKNARSSRRQVVLLDRCNLQASDRKEWLALAHNTKKVWVLFFDVSSEECRWRIVRRQGHPTIKQGRGGRIIDSLANTLEVPTLEEGFDKIFTIRTFDDSSNLLSNWGCLTMPRSTIPEEIGLIKFPRTRHIQNIGSATRDDLIMSADEVHSSYLNRHLCVEEKIDGANMGISIRNNKICAQNRSHFVGSAYHAQFRYLDKWIHQHSDELWSVLESDRYILYGEWVYARHSIHYTSLPDWFVAFDMYDCLEQKFWCRSRLEKLLEGTSIALIPVIADKTFATLQELRSLVQTKSSFYNGVVEGVYVRFCDDQWVTDRGKIVRSDFLSGDEFWSKGGVHPNLLDKDAYQNKAKNY